MDKKFTIYLVLGLLIGVLFGTAFAPVLTLDIIGVAGGAIFGLYISWFIAAAMQKKQH